MFNVIKGEFVNQSREPVVIKHISDKQRKTNFDLEKESSQRLEELNKKIEQKKEELEKLEIEFENIKINSENEAIKLIEEANEKIAYEMQVSKNQGYQEGYQVGIEDGKEEILESSKYIIEDLNNIIQEISDLKEKIVKLNEKEILNLAFNIAKKVIKKEILEDETIVKNNLSEALKKISIPKKINIIINWEDLDYIKSIKEEVLKSVGGIRNVEIIENINVEKGGCIIETNMGTIDASISSQLDEIFEHLIK